ncbi:MAG: 5-formyltetrahydrofolate cyclo-ligase [Ilumatobacteraceae bacterium]
MHDADATAAGADAIDVRKRARRADLRRIRRQITADPDDRLARSARIWARIVSLADLSAPGPRLLLFEGLATEPATEDWFAWCRAQGVAAFAPEVDGPDLRVVPGDLDPAELDVVVVPGLAFTADGRRLGQGGGHYDRFLPRLRPDCLTIGACFVEQLVTDLPTEPHDACVMRVATDA